MAVERRAAGMGDQLLPFPLAKRIVSHEKLPVCVESH
jgi:hypothetical protein